MSHNVTISDIKISDINALETAISNLQNQGIDITLETGTLYVGYAGREESGYTHVIKMGDSRYDIGLKADAEGNFIPVFDPWGGDVNRVVGLNPTEFNEAELHNVCNISDPKVHIGKLMQEYGLCKAEYEAAIQGYSSQRIPGEGGQQQLVVTGY